MPSEADAETAGKAVTGIVTRIVAVIGHRRKVNRSPAKKPRTRLLENPPGDFSFAETISEQAQETVATLPEAEPDASPEFVAETRFRKPSKFLAR